MTPNARATLDRLEKANKDGLPKFCKDCAFHHCKYDREEGRIWHTCRHPFCADLVTGLATNPYDNRKSDSLCGRSGKYWTQRQKKEVESTDKTSTRSADK